MVYDIWKVVWTSVPGQSCTRYTVSRIGLPVNISILTKGAWWDDFRQRCAVQCGVPGPLLGQVQFGQVVPRVYRGLYQVGRVGRHWGGYQYSLAQVQPSPGTA